VFGGSNTHTHTHTTGWPPLNNYILLLLYVFVLLCRVFFWYFTYCYCYVCSFPCILFHCIILCIVCVYCSTATGCQPTAVNKYIISYHIIYYITSHHIIYHIISYHIITPNWNINVTEHLKCGALPKQKQKIYLSFLAFNSAQK
jgi:hypothetical protein